mgnify:CR=1 FL=1|jgi:hypothetical protein
MRDDEVFKVIDAEQQLNYLNNHFNDLTDEQRVKQKEIEEWIDELYLEVFDMVSESVNDEF